MEVAALGLKVDGIGNVDQAAASLEGLVSCASAAEQATDGVSKSTGRARDQFGRFVKSTDAASTSVGGLGEQAKRTQESLGGFSKSNTKASESAAKLGDNSKKTSVGMSGLGDAAKKAGGVIVAAFSINAIKNYADTWSDLQSKIGSATGDMENAGARMQRIVDIANASYSPLEQTAAVYARNVATFRDLGRNATEAADFTEALNHAMVITATKGDDAAVVINSLSRSLAIGKLDADAFDTIVSRSPRTLQAMADNMGVATSTVRELARQGKVSADVIADSLIESLDQLREEAGKMPATIGDAFVRITNNVTEFVGKIDKASGASGTVAEAILDMADGIRTAGDYIIRVGQLSAPVFGAVSSAVSYVAQYADIAVAALAGFYAPAMIGGIALLAKGLMTGVVGALKAVAVAVMANPLSLFVAALAAAGYAAYKFRDEIQQAIGVDVIGSVKKAANMVIGAFVGAYDSIGAIWKNFGSVMGSAFTSAVNAYIKYINLLINTGINGINSLIQKANAIPGIELPQLSNVAGIKQIEDTFTDGAAAIAEAGAKMGEALNKDYIGAASGKLKEAFALSPTAVPVDGAVARTALGASDPKKDKAAKKQAEDAQKFLDSLKQQVFQLEKRTALEQMYFDIQQQGIVLSETQLSQAIALANQIDAAAQAERDKEAAIDRQNALYALQENLISKQQQYQAELSTAGMGDKAAEQLRARLDLEQQQQKEIRDMQQQHGQEMREAETEAERAHLQTMFEERMSLTRSFQEQELEAYAEFMEQKKELEGNWAAGAQEAFANYAEQAGDIYGQTNDMVSGVLTTMTDGISSAFTKAILYGEDLKASLANVGKAILEQVVGALVKIGVQYAINAAIGQTLGTAVTATSAAQAAALSAAWSAPAALASLATVGANAIPAQAGIATTLATTKAMTAAGFKDGGYTGSIGANNVAGVVHGNEYVFDAAATSRIGVPTLEAIRSGRPMNAVGSTPKPQRAARENVTVNQVNNFAYPDNKTATQIANATARKERVASRLTRG